jgi:hypothetical protein
MSTIHTLREALEARGNTVTVPAHAVESAIRQGYAVRRRRRVVAGVGTTVLAAAVAVPIAIGWSPDRDTGPAVPTPSVSSDPTPDGSTPPPTSAPLTPLLPLGAAATLPYAIGNVLVDGDVRLELPTQIWGFTKVGDQYAVISATEDENITRLDLVWRDGNIRELDRGLILGVVAGDGDSGIALAWGWQPSMQGGPASLKAYSALDQLPTIHELEPDTLAARVVAVAAGGVVVAYQGDPEGPPALWDVEAGSVLPLIDDVTEGGRSLAGLTADGSLAVVFDAYGSGCLTAHDLDDGDRQVWEECTRQAAGSLSPDGSLIYEGFAVFNAATGTLQQQFEVPSFEFPAGAVWEDGDHVLLSDTGIEEVPADGPLVRCTISTGACERVPVELDLQGSQIIFGQR